jgi:hypothetical protein
MLNQVLQEISNTREPVSLPVLSHKLGIERSALEGMLTYWVRKGRLQVGDGDSDTGSSEAVCASGSCGSSCPGVSGCPFIAKMPKTYAIVAQENSGINSP